MWALNVILYKLQVGGGVVGEPWLWPASPLQLLGFTFVLAGTLLYAQVSPLAPPTRRSPPFLGFGLLP